MSSYFTFDAASSPAYIPPPTSPAFNIGTAPLIHPPILPIEFMALSPLPPNTDKASKE